VYCTASSTPPAGEASAESKGPSSDRSSQINRTNSTTTVYTNGTTTVYTNSSTPTVWEYTDGIIAHVYTKQKMLTHTANIYVQKGNFRRLQKAVSLCSLDDLFSSERVSRDHLAAMGAVEI
jgi:hypothetical protein